MIKFLAKMESGNMLGIGLSEKNVELLKEGKPINIDLDEMISPGGGHPTHRAHGFEAYCGVLWDHRGGNGEGPQGRYLV